MWTVEIFAGIIFAGIIFLLWFLVQLFREHPFRSGHVIQIRPIGSTNGKPLQLQSDWAAVRREPNAVTLHSIWRYGVSHVTEVEKGEPSCGISSSY